MRTILTLLVCLNVIVQVIAVQAQDIAVPESSIKLTEREGTSLVVAQGVGTNSDEALRDAFRESVRQAVGLFVDAQTQIKNDELIEDRVLTYSNAYVKTYRKISESTRGGLVRIKISALVQKTKLIEKLKAENISIKKVDGKGLFAEAMTKLDSNVSAQEMLFNALKGFPHSLLDANHPPKPTIVSQNETHATLRLTVSVSPSRERFQRFAASLNRLLAEAATDKGVYVAKFKFHQNRQDDERHEWSRFEPELFNTGRQYEGFKDWFPAVFNTRGTELNGKGLFVAVTDKATSRATRLTTKWFKVDENLRETIRGFANQPVNLLVTYQNGEGNQIAVEKAKVENRVRRGKEYFAGSPVCSCYGSPGEWPKAIAGEVREDSRIVWFLPVHPQARNTDIWFRETLEIDTNVTLTLDELKSIRSVSCQFTP